MREGRELIKQFSHLPKRLGSRWYKANGGMQPECSGGAMGLSLKPATLEGKAEMVERGILVSKDTVQMSR